TTTAPYRLPDARPWFRGGGRDTRTLPPALHRHGGECAVPDRRGGPRRRQTFPAGDLAEDGPAAPRRSRRGAAALALLGADRREAGRAPVRSAAQQGGRW